MTQFPNCDFNVYYGFITRQFGAKKFPDPAIMEKFTNWFNKKKKDIEQNLNLCLGDLEHYDQKDFIEQTDPKKRKIYANTLETPDNLRIYGAKYEVLVKTNEIHMGNQENGVRARLVFNPDNETKVFGSYLARNMMKLLKSEKSELRDYIMTGLSHFDVADKITSNIHKLPGHELRSKIGFASADGGSHDAHQHPELIKLVDFWFLRTFGPKVLMKTDIPADVHRLLIKRLTCLKSKFSAYGSKPNGEKLNLLCKGVAYGTVWSGNPVLTTLGNTIRVIMYNLFARDMMNEELNSMGQPQANVYPQVAGDDNFMILTGNYKHWPHYFYKYIGDATTEGQQGLG